MKVGIVHGYGLYLPERKDYQAYLDFIAEEIKLENFDKVILCGGFTVPEHPDKSEASTAREYLLTKIDFDNYILEDRSINTNQNLAFAAEHLEQLGSVNQIIVYGDLTRKGKIAWIAMHEILGLNQKEIYRVLIEYIHQKDVYKDIAYSNLLIRGFDFPGKTKEEMIGLSYTAILDVMALYDDELKEMDLEYRRKLFGLK